MAKRSTGIRLLYAASVCLFLVCFARFYDPAYGFSGLIRFATTPEEELPALRAVPHPRQIGGGGYDGQFYVQMAIEPLLTDAAIDRGMDNAAYRARRILFSWTAWGLGLGHAPWIVQAYATQNAIAWLILAYVLTFWFPATSVRNFAAWAGCLFTHGLVVSVCFALVDGPGALLIACGVLAVSRGRPWLGALTMGISGLARETNLLGAAALIPGADRSSDSRTLDHSARAPGHPAASRWRAAGRVAGQALLVLLPLALWMDYLRSLYGSRVLAGGDHLVAPGSGLGRAWDAALSGVLASGWQHPARFSLLAIVALATQIAWLVAVRRWRDPWWRVGVAWAALVLCAHWVVWQGYPGAVTRIALPLTFAFNALLPRNRWFWPLWAMGNLTVIPGLALLEVPWLSRFL